jgi:hypothetical protein
MYINNVISLILVICVCLCQRFHHLWHALSRRREKARSSRHDIVSRCVPLEVGVDSEGSQVEDAAARGRGYVIYSVT